MDLAAIAARTGIAPRQLRYAADHGLLPGLPDSRPGRRVRAAGAHPRRLERIAAPARGLSGLRPLLRQCSARARGVRAEPAAVVRLAPIGNRQRRARRPSTTRAGPAAGPGTGTSPRG